MMKTYEDKLKAEGRVSTGTFDCPECGRGPHPAFAIIEREPGRWTCSVCYEEESIAQRQADEAEVRASLPPWETEQANEIRAYRNQLQSNWRWTVMPDSPLTTEAQERCMVYLQSLNRLTIDFQSPTDVVWPTIPTIEANDYAS